MNFWDSSAIIPLIVHEADTALRTRQLREDPTLTVWYGSVVEIESSLARKRRENSMNASDLKSLRASLRNLSMHWDEVQPSNRLRDRAVRCLHTHPLRAADAFQLAAALLACGDYPQNHTFLTGDLRLREAAEREGFSVDD